MAKALTDSNFYLKNLAYLKFLFNVENSLFFNCITVLRLYFSFFKIKLVSQTN